MLSVRSGSSARSRLSESSSRLTRSGPGHSFANAAWIGPTAAGVAWIRAMRMAPLDRQRRLPGLAAAGGLAFRLVVLVDLGHHGLCRLRAGRLVLGLCVVVARHAQGVGLALEVR